VRKMCPDLVPSFLFFSVFPTLPEPANTVQAVVRLLNSWARIALYMLSLTPVTRSYELCFGFNRQAITKSRSLGYAFAISKPMRFRSIWHSSDVANVFSTVTLSSPGTILSRIMTNNHIRLLSAAPAALGSTSWKFFTPTVVSSRVFRHVPYWPFLK
jgi:hypothetical protein